jgi:hypothetical protein
MGILLTAGLGYPPSVGIGTTVPDRARRYVVGPVAFSPRASRRDNLVIGIVAMIGVTWSTVLLWPRPSIAPWLAS